MEKKLSVVKRLKGPIVTFTTYRQNTESKLLTVEEVAQLLRVPISWVYGRSRKNAIPVIRLGKKYIRFNAEEILAWASAGCPKQWAPKKLTTDAKTHHFSLLNKR